MFVKTLRVQKPVQYFHLCKAELSEGEKCPWHESGYHNETAVASIICLCCWLAKFQQFQPFDILLDWVVFTAIKEKKRKNIFLLIHPLEFH